MQVNFIDTPATGGVSAIREAAPARLHAQLGPSELRTGEEDSGRNQHHGTREFSVGTRQAVLLPQKGPPSRSRTPMRKASQRPCYRLHSLRETL